MKAMRLIVDRAGLRSMRSFSFLDSYTILHFANGHIFVDRRSWLCFGPREPRSLPTPSSAIPLFSPPEQASAAISASRRTDSPEIDEAPLDIDREQLHANPVADIQAIEPLDEFPFHRHLEEPYPGAFIGGSRHDGVEPFVDPRAKQKRCRGFVDLPLDLVGGILFFGAVFRQGLQLILAIGTGIAPEGGLQQALGDQIGIAAIRGGGMGIIPDREAKVSRGRVCRAVRPCTPLRPGA